MIENKIVLKTIEAVSDLYGVDINCKNVQFQKTNKEFDGDYTIVVFPFVRYAKKSPEATANEIGEYLVKNITEVECFGVVKGFLNLSFTNGFWYDFFSKTAVKLDYGFSICDESSTFVVEYSSPNTNKPLHLGHIRNNLLGYSVSEILKASGKNVKKVNLVNDRGIHICKSMLAWQKWGNGETPKSSGLKGDHLVGKYYVIFDKYYKEEIKSLVNNGLSEDEAKKKAPLIIEAQIMLKKWENNDSDVVGLWKMMNEWVYKGFDITYDRLGVDFDKTYYESNTYLLGKSLVDKGVKDNKLLKKKDGSVWADFSKEGYDNKLLLRSDGTSVYITQDLGTALERHKEYSPEKLIYVVGNEQDYHFDILKKVLNDKLDMKWSSSIYHLSYGMVELPHGKMKSREGTVVDADELMDEMTRTAEKITTELGKINDFPKKERDELYEMIGMGALKYFILKVDPKKKMLFNPEDSIDFNGNTSSFIQYTYARIRSVIRKAKDKDLCNDNSIIPLIDIPKKEKELIKLFFEFNKVIQQSADTFSPALIANYIFELSKEYNQFYHEFPILKEEDADLAMFRVFLSDTTANIIKNAMKLLGIQVPERM